MADDIKKIKTSNEKIVPTINKVVEIIKHYFNLDLSDEKYEKIFNVLLDTISSTNKFAKKNGLAKKSKDAYKTLFETTLYFFKTISEHYNNIDKK